MAALPCQAPTWAPAPVPVVSPLFCAPYLVQLTVHPQKSSGYTVTNASGAVVLTARAKSLSLHNRLVLLDAAGHPIITLKEKILTMHDRWEVFRGDSSDAGDLLFYTTKKSNTEMDVFLAARTSHGTCDFRMNGDYGDRKAYCDFYLANTNAKIARIMSRNSDSSVLLEVLPHVDHVFVGALVVILNEIHKEEDSSESIDIPSVDDIPSVEPVENYQVENYSAENYTFEGF